MKTNCHRCLALILVASLGGAYAVGEEAAKASLSQVVFFRSLKFESAGRLALESERTLIVRMKDGEKEKKIPVGLIARSYSFRGTKIVDGKVSSFEPSGGLFCYELRSQDKDHLFEWSFWSTSVCGCFKLLDDVQTGSHLAFVEGLDVFIARIDAHRDSASELTAFTTNGGTLPSEFIRVPVSDLIPRDEFRGLNALYSDDIKIDSVGISGKRIAVGLSSRLTKKTFLLEYDAKKWKRK